ncbi:MAG TPA: hypothetical protein VJS12_04655 [Steroidobacteraceae bacterium]|nr:hypothetical protein [Steroidobacteraceae bacterium]
MAKDNSTSKIGRGRKGGVTTDTAQLPSTRAAKRASSKAADANPSEDFGGERAILMKAEAVLACLSVSLNYYGWSGDDGTLYAVATDVARDLVQQGMDRLELRQRQLETSKRRPN